MTKIIIVQGVANTQKSTSIRAFAARYNFNIMQSGDFTVAKTLVKSPASFQAGIATGGDTGQMVTDNLKFFMQNNCDLMICACRTYGATVQVLQSHILANGWTPIWIQANRHTGNISAHVNSIVQSIDNNI
ncbi:hypothetical protein [Devosia sp. FKR38]|uniref:hypothetical protein n=1 Tax=Devosia sp. FKR38 TaxID=2562312 RepID=UPI0010BFDC1C|nr:hypothetical protein [Devosia sp. FKR38]